MNSIAGLFPSCFVLGGSRLEPRRSDWISWDLSFSSLVLKAKYHAPSIQRLFGSLIIPILRLKKYYVKIIQMTRSHEIDEEKFHPAWLLVIWTVVIWLYFFPMYVAKQGGSNFRLIFGRGLVRTSTKAPILRAQIYRGFPQFIRQMSGQYLKLGHDFFLPHPFHLIISQYFIPRCVQWATGDRIVKWVIKKWITICGSRGILMDF
jgi:hypothetical protein